MALSVIGFVRLPTGSGALSDGTAEYGLVLPLNIDLGDTYNLKAQISAEPLAFS